MQLTGLRPREQGAVGVVASGTGDELVEGAPDWRQARSGARDGTGARFRNVGEKERIDDEMLVLEGQVGDLARCRDEAVDGRADAP